MKRNESHIQLHEALHTHTHIDIDRYKAQMLFSHRKHLKNDVDDDIDGDTNLY